MQADYPGNMTFMKQKAKIRERKNIAAVAQQTCRTCSESCDSTSKPTCCMKDAG